jgi:hypothetical protein
MQDRFAVYQQEEQLWILTTTSLLLSTFTPRSYCADQARPLYTNMAKNKQQQEKPVLSFDDMIKAGV